VYGDEPVLVVCLEMWKSMYCKAKVTSQVKWPFDIKIEGGKKERSQLQFCNVMELVL
jgi:hypothetical protein